MPTTKIDLPRALEARKVDVDDKKGVITIDHRLFNNGTPAIPVLYLTCTGTGGMTSRAVLMLNTTNGKYQVKQIDDTAPVTSRFDLSPEEYAKACQAARAKANANLRPDAAGPVVEAEPVPEPLPDEE